MGRHAKIKGRIASFAGFSIIKAVSAGSLISLALGALVVTAPAQAEVADATFAASPITIFPGESFSSEITTTATNPVFTIVGEDSDLIVTSNGLLSSDRDLVAGSTNTFSVRVEGDDAYDETATLTVNVSTGVLPKTTSAITTSADGPFIGDQIWASAFERTLSSDILSPPEFIVAEVSTPEEYVYRITKQENDVSSLLDSQSVQGYTSLTSAKQDEWYEADMMATSDFPYVFNWVVFVCYDGENSDKATKVQLPTNLSVNYSSLESAFTGAVINPAENANFRKVLTGIESSLDPFSASLYGTRSVVGDFKPEVTGDWVNSNVPYGVSAVTGDCPEQFILMGLPVVADQEVSTSGLTIGKSLTVPAVLSFEDPFVFGEDALLSLPAVGATLGVTGVYVPLFNAALWGLTTIKAAGPVTDPATGPTTPYAGPSVDPLSNPSVSAGTQLKIQGQQLASVTKVEIAGVSLKPSLVTNTSFEILLPLSLGSGVYDLLITSSFGVLRLQDYLRVVAQAGSNQPDSNQSIGQWTKLQPSKTTVKFYAKTPVGLGKIQFFANGKEVAWIRAVDESDRKLAFASGSPYLVRSFALQPGKNRLEIWVNGKRIWRSTYAG